MSIINDALKKAEKFKKRNKVREGEKLEQSPPETKGLQEEPKVRIEAQRPSILKPSITKRRRRLYAKKKIVIHPILYVAGATLLILLVVAILPKGKKAVETSTPSPVIPTAKKEAPPPKATPPPAPEKKPDEFTLTGIVHGEGMPMAIIDGSVYMIGDSIEGAKVVTIAENTVILDKEGKIIELKAR